jgi:hypothetical protein
LAAGWLSRRPVPAGGTRGAWRFGWQRRAGAQSGQAAATNWRRCGCRAGSAAAAPGGRRAGTRRLLGVVHGELAGLRPAGDEPDQGRPGLLQRFILRELGGLKPAGGAAADWWRGSRTSRPGTPGAGGRARRGPGCVPAAGLGVEGVARVRRREGADTAEPDRSQRRLLGSRKGVHRCHPLASSGGWSPSG